MREDKLGELSMELSVEILQPTKELRVKRENVISDQIGRSATSICANIAESRNSMAVLFKKTIGKFQAVSAKLLRFLS